MLFVYSLRFFFWFDLTSHNVTPKLVGFPPKKSVGPPRTWFTECHSEVGSSRTKLVGFPPKKSVGPPREKSVGPPRKMLVWLLASRASGGSRAPGFWLLELLEVLELLASGVAMMMVVEEKPRG